MSKAKAPETSKWSYYYPELGETRQSRRYLTSHTRTASGYTVALWVARNNYDNTNLRIGRNGPFTVAVISSDETEKHYRIYIKLKAEVYVREKK